MPSDTNNMVAPLAPASAFIKPSPLKGQSLMDLPVTRPNLFEPYVGSYSSKLPYNYPIKFVRNPYIGHQSRRLHFTVRNLPFDRVNSLSADLTLLVRYISKCVLPWYAAQHEVQEVQQEVTAPYFAQFLHFKEDCDAVMVENPNPKKNHRMVPAKERHIVIETNCPYLVDVLSDRRLFILADLMCFHVCWDKTLVQNGNEYDDTAIAYKHDVQAMKHFCNAVWEQTGLRERHRITEGYPCANIKFEFIRDVSDQEWSNSLMFVEEVDV
eukprot:GILI01005860.1.p1 GENE.GILI01005860.1~~GILI01005860.1.p1  ORF type:complete len:268 (+),score=39.62 GILI01005860.1:80-883(+)